MINWISQIEMDEKPFNNTHTDIDNVGGKSSQYDYKVSMMVKRPTQKADGSGEYTGDIIFGSNDGLGENHWIKKDGQFGIRFSSTSPQLTLDNSEPRDEWVYFSYTFNTVANGAFLRECTFGDVTYSNLNLPMGGQTAPDKFRRFRTFLWGSGASIYIDDFKCEFVDVPPTANVTASAPGVVKFGEAEDLETVISATGASATVTVDVDSDDNWLSMSGEFTKQVEVAPGEPVSIGLTANLPEQVRNMPAATITYSYYNGEEDKSFTHSVVAQNGNKGLGWALYATDFERMPLGGDVKLQPAWGETGAAGDNENFLQFRNYTFSGSDGYYIDNFKVELIKSGTLPEPAFLGVLALLGLFAARRQR